MANVMPFAMCKSPTNPGVIAAMGAPVPCTPTCSIWLGGKHVDDGDDNNVENLILIKADPYHTAFTNYQKKHAGDLEHGQSRDIDWPTPYGTIYTTV